MNAGDDEETRVARLVVRVATLDDHDAFAEIVRIYHRPVRRFLARLTHGNSASDDLAQDTFLKAYQHIGSFEGRGRFASWLFRIAYQEFVSHARTHRTWEAPLCSDPADGGTGDRLVAKLTLERAMVSLRPEERAAIDLHYREQLTQTEIAAVLDLPHGTVKSLILRGRDKLRDILTGPIVKEHAQ